MKVYVDTSFLASLYSPDANSLLPVRVIQTRAATFQVSTLGGLEFFNALELRVFRKEISSAQARSSRSAFETDVQNSIFHLSPLPDQIFTRARLLSHQTTARLGTRTADILHVAAALELKADSFYSFDRQQRKLAQSVRLKTNPT